MLPSSYWNLAGSFFVTGFIRTCFALLDAFSELWTLGWEIFSNSNVTIITEVLEDQLHLLSKHTSCNCFSFFLKSRNILETHQTSNAPTSVPFKLFLRSGDKPLRGLIWLFCLPSFPPRVLRFQKWERSFYYPHPNNMAGELTLRKKKRETQIQTDQSQIRKHVII